MENNFDKKCFVLMPFSEKLREVYDEIYKPVCQENSIHCWRVDEISKPGSITKDIIEGILEADIIIADLTDKNPNVFYELGIAHSVGNKTIMTAQGLDNVPFDIANYRVILYEQTLLGCKKLHLNLSTAVKELLVALDRTNNPFQEVLASRGSLRMKQKVPLIKVINRSKLSTPVKNLFKEQGIQFLDDIKSLNFKDLISRDGFGKESLSQICTIALEYDLYGDFDEFNKFVVENSINTRNKTITTNISD